MANVRQGFSDKNRNGRSRNSRALNDKKQYEDSFRSIAVRKAKRNLMLIIILVIVLIIAIGVAIYNSAKEYTSYKTMETADIDDGAGSQYVAYGTFFVKYGLDGITYLNGDESVWSHAYEMTNPIIDVCEDYVAVADKGKNTVYVFDETGSEGIVTTKYPIISIEVANQGVVAALLEEDTANYIEVYDKDGDELISHKTLLGGNGYPLSFSLSNDGKKMMVSYVSVNGGTTESKVVFYNFSDVGQNEVDRMVGGFNHYNSTIIPTVKFLTNNLAIAVGDNVLSIYKMKEKPSLQEDIPIEKEIKKLFYDDKYIGMVFDNETGNDLYEIKVYNTNGNEVMSQTIDAEFDDIKFSGKNILIYDDMSCSIISFSGKEKFKYRFKEAITDIIPTDKFREYLIITNNKVKRIKIK